MLFDKTASNGAGRRIFPRTYSPAGTGIRLLPESMKVFLPLSSGGSRSALKTGKPTCPGYKKAADNAAAFSGPFPVAYSHSIVPGGLEVMS